MLRSLIITSCTAPPDIEFLSTVLLTFFVLAVDAYVQSLGRPELLDLVARSDAMEVDGVEDLRPNKKAVVYGEVMFPGSSRYKLIS